MESYKSGNDKIQQSLLAYTMLWSSSVHRCMNELYAKMPMSYIYHEYAVVSKYFGVYLLQIKFLFDDWNDIYHISWLISLYTPSKHILLFVDIYVCVSHINS